MFNTELYLSIVRLKRKANAFKARNNGCEYMKALLELEELTKGVDDALVKDAYRVASRYR